MLEKMSTFFENRLGNYDWHMLNEIDSATEFYPCTAEQLPKAPESHILDLGCGTGLELEFYFSGNPAARVTGIDLSEKMLAALAAKFPDKDLQLICGSYFEEAFGENRFDAAVSVESLHHFTMEEKIPLYTRLHAALKDGGYFILTDYFALSDEEELLHQKTLKELKAEQGICDNAFYHYDTPLTVAHETQALLAAGFAAVEVLKNWGATYLLKAIK